VSGEAGGISKAAFMKCPKRVVASITWAAFFIIADVAFSNVVTFEETYTYQASEYDSKVSCRALAIAQVKRLLLERLGTYLESETEVKNFQLTKDQIVILTAGIVGAEIIDEKWDGQTYFLKARITADPQEVAKSIDNLRQDRQKTKELEETRRKADEALREVERLKRELEIAKVRKTEQDQYRKAVNKLSATDWFQKGYALGIAGRSQEALEAFARAIELNPNFSLAYNNRGIAYLKLGDYQKAIKDHSKAIELDPTLALAYNNRGTAYYHLGDYRQAIKDYSKAIELDPTLALAYNNRGTAYYHLGDYRQAVKEFNRAIDLNPEDSRAYNNRGAAYHHLGDYKQAIDDYKTSARLGHKPAQDFLESQGIEW
jgi:tetratricopeptide (TPR) repeat protein